jgi:hypothetical protein
MILLANQVILPRELFRLTYENEWEGEQLHDIEYSANLMMFKLGGHMAVVTNVPEQIPESELGDATRRASLWPDARRDVKRHLHHVVVSMIGPDHAREKYRSVTRIVATMISLLPEAMGVFWPSARHLIERDAFASNALCLKKGTDPVALWVSAETSSGANGGSSGRTHGLRELGMTDFCATHLPEPVQSLQQRLMGLAEYVLAGNAIADGDTATVDADSQIHFKVGNSPLARSQKLMYLNLVGGPVKKPWWKRK